MLGYSHVRHCLQPHTCMHELLAQSSKVQAHTAASMCVLLWCRGGNGLKQSLTRKGSEVQSVRLIARPNIGPCMVHPFLMQNCREIFCVTYYTTRKTQFTRTTAAQGNGVPRNRSADHLHNMATRNIIGISC